LARSGKYCCFCASEPEDFSTCAVELCTCIIVAKPPSAAANSSIARQYSTNVDPDPPYSCGASIPMNPTSSTVWISSRGQAPVRARSAAVASTTSVTILREHSRIMSSCSLRNALDTLLISYPCPGFDVELNRLQNQPSHRLRRR